MLKRSILRHFVFISYIHSTCPVCRADARSLRCRNFASMFGTLCQIFIYFLACISGHSFQKICTDLKQYFWKLRTFCRMLSTAQLCEEITSQSLADLKKVRSLYRGHIPEHIKCPRGPQFFLFITIYDKIACEARFHTPTTRVQKANRKHGDRNRHATEA